MIYLISRIINTLANLIVLLVVVNTVLSYFLQPYHPIRITLDRLLQPFLAPIRRIVPLVGMFDLSPLILIVIVEILAFVLVSILQSL